METVAQFAIRGDTDDSGSQITEVPEATSGKGSVRGGSSLRNEVTAAAQPSSAAQVAHAIPAGISEMSATEAYESSIMESPPLPERSPDRDNTPTVHNTADVSNSNAGYFPSMTSSLNANAHDATYEPDTPFLRDGFYGASSAATPLNTNVTSAPQPSSSNYDPQSAMTESSGFDFDRSVTPTPPAARYDSKPSLSMAESSMYYEQQLAYAPPPHQQQHGDLWSPPTQQRQVSGAAGGAASRPSTGESVQEEWPQEAIMHMNLGNRVKDHRGNQVGSGYDGMYYGSAM